MTPNIYPTYDNSMFELSYKFYGKDDCLYVKETVELKELEYLFYCAEHEHITVCFIRTNTICPKCGKKLHFNGKSERNWDKKRPVKLQNYIHKNCNVHKKASLAKFRDKHCCYTRQVRDGGINSALISYRSYESKSEELNHYYKTNISPSTIYYSEITYFWKYYDDLVKIQQDEIKKRGIKPSGHYSYDEQYVFVNKKLYLRMTIIDVHTKLIIADTLVNEEEFNETTIKDFLESHLKDKKLKSITTDGRNTYNNIIKALKAVHHRCFFHQMQNLMTPLQKHVNKLNRKIKTNKNKIEENKQEIIERKNKYPPIKGRIPKSGIKRIKNRNKIQELEQKNKDLRKENKEMQKELNIIENDKTRIQKIFKSQNQKQAYRRFHTIYNQRNQLEPIIKKFLEKMNKNIDILLNHMKNKGIPATNNVVENYYRTTLPRKHKRIYRTLKGLERRIKEEQLRWTHRIVLKQNTNINKNTQY